MSCKHFTLQPRPAEDDNERLRDFDRQYAAIGWGRCAFSSGLSWLWYPGESLRQCDRHKPLAADPVAARRAWVAAQQTRK